MAAPVPSVRPSARLHKMAAGRLIACLVLVAFAAQDAVQQLLNLSRETARRAPQPDASAQQWLRSLVSTQYGGNASALAADVARLGQRLRDFQANLTRTVVSDED